MGVMHALLHKSMEDPLVQRMVLVSGDTVRARLEECAYYNH